MILGILGTIVTVLVLLNRLAEAGIDLAGLNPFLWQRRRQWQRKMEGNPVYHISNPLDATALLATATAKADGDMSSEEKRSIRTLFHQEFNMPKREAAELLIASAYLLGNGEDVNTNLEKVLKPSLENFTEEQAKSALSLLNAVGEIDPVENELKRNFIERIRAIFDAHFEKDGKWS